ncbi:MAG: polyphosphate kinase 1 [candidate division KSB1 bacterium]|nr:polyphosphate kinase 1 [candidate division KSB1 bacterium]MDZ7366718.1 polyphosphate kinase 1 [candidate division KSB1 bacterium]MDZ7404731.1 polyphosphate kinase 1 [candidate division KSB1 bacterium]
MKRTRWRNKELSWLSFNARVLQEAADASVPLLERLKFLGIFSSNLDEFFRVRVAVLKRLTKFGKKAVSIVGDDPKKVLAKIHEVVLSQQAEFNRIYQEILQELEREKIFIINERQLEGEQARFVKDYFRQHVRPTLVPLMIDQLPQFPELKDHAIYLAVCLSSASEAQKTKYALIELPAVLPRFLVLPPQGENQYLILLDDVIRFCLDEIFSIFNFDRFSAFTIKLTRDAELDIDQDISESLIRKVHKSVKQRKLGTPVRFIYDRDMPEDLLKFLIRNLQLSKTDGNLMPGARYHNFKDFINFPKIGPPHLRYNSFTPLPHHAINHQKSLFKIIQKRDILLHYPYHTFDYVIDLLREAAIDPHVTAIKITLYRVAKNSNVINALINAAKNGKSVTAVVELQARFDEEVNVHWAQLLQEEGVRVIDGVPGLKVHAKLILIHRKEKHKTIRYACLGTGNFNETTAKIYSDHSFLTCHAGITREVEQVFDFLENKYQRSAFKHLLVSPFNMRQRLTKLIDEEIRNAQKGKEAFIIFKLNNLVDQGIIKKLYKAGQAGVGIKLMVRGMFSLIPGSKEGTENIQAAAIVDKFLEHSRLFVFCGGGKKKYYLSSADLMSRNLDYRVEVACPIYDKTIQHEIDDFLHLQWQDNVKTRVLNKDLDNQYRHANPEKQVRAQEALYEYFKTKQDTPPGVEIEAAEDGSYQSNCLS